jgi:hypothetical protein
VSRPLAIASALVLLLTAAAAAPIPKEKAKAPDYYPTALGSKWVYKVGETEMTFVVTAVERKKDETLATIENQLNGLTAATERLSVSDKGVFRTELNKAVVDPPFCILKSPHKPGDKWDADSNVRGQQLKVAFATRESEEVAVPAGKYKAVRVDGDGVLAGTATKVTYWFAPDVGIVKLRHVLANGDLVLELKSFTPGKKD